MKTRVFVDMDGVLARWNPDASLEEVASPGYFANRECEESIKNAVNILANNENLELYILSSVYRDDHSRKEKNIWLDNFGVNIPKERRLFPPYGDSKSLFIESMVGIKNTDVLIDDFTKNLNEWHGVGIKFRNKINGTKGTWTSYSIDYRMQPKEMAKLIYGLAS